jgi:hypothetical protein
MANDPQLMGKSGDVTPNVVLAKKSRPKAASPKSSDLLTFLEHPPHYASHP